MSAQRHGLRAVADFYCFEQLTSLRLPVSLRLFRYLLVGAYLVAMVVLLAGSLVTFTLAAGLIGVRASAGYAVTAICCFANVYVGGGYILREAFSGRRFTVSNSPNLHFFRALDIRATHVLVVYCALRTTMFYLALLLVDLAFVAVFRRSVGMPVASVAAVSTPVSMYLVTLAVAVKAANRRTRPEPMRRSMLALLAALAFGLGYGTARFLIGPLRDAGIDLAFSHRQAVVLATGLGVAAVLAGIGSVIWIVVGVRRLSRDGFSMQEAPASARPARPGIPALGPVVGGITSPWPLPAVLHRELVGSWVYALVRKTFGVLAAVLLAALGVVAARVPVFPLGHLPGRFVLVVYSLMFVTLLGVAELVLRAIGPTTFAGQFRAAWENQLSQWNVAGSAIAYYLTPLMLLAVGFAALLRIVVGGSFSGPVSVGVVVLSATLIAESVTSTQHNVDGTSAPTMVSGLVALLVAAPVLFALSMNSVAGEILAGVYGVGLLGGAVACVGRRIRTLPSNSAT